MLTHSSMLTHCLDGRRDGTFTWCLDVRGSQCQLATEPTSSTPARATLNIVTCITGWLRLSSQQRPLPTTIRQPVLTANRRNIEWGFYVWFVSRSRFASLSSVASMLVGGRLLFPWTREFDVYMLVRSCVNKIVDEAIVAATMPTRHEGGTCNCAPCKIPKHRALLMPAGMSVHVGRAGMAHHRESGPDHHVAQAGLCAANA
jgi:hypothetical protein